MDTRIARQESKRRICTRGVDPAETGKIKPRSQTMLLLYSARNDAESGGGPISAEPRCLIADFVVGNAHTRAGGTEYRPATRSSALCDGRTALRSELWVADAAAPFSDDVTRSGPPHPTPAKPRPYGTQESTFTNVAWVRQALLRVRPDRDSPQSARAAMPRDSRDSVRRAYSSLLIGVSARSPSRRIRIRGIVTSA